MLADQKPRSTACTFFLQPCIAHPHHCVALALRARLTMISAPARLLRYSRPDRGKCFVTALRARLTMGSTPARLRTTLCARLTMASAPALLLRFSTPDQRCCSRTQKGRLPHWRDTIDSTWSSCKAYPKFAAFAQPAFPLVFKVLAVALCLAPARCGAANCRSDRKEMEKETAGNGRYNLRVASAKRKTPLKLSPLSGRFWGDSMCVSLN